MRRWASVACCILLAALDRAVFLTPVDLLAKILYKGLHRLPGLGEEIFKLLRYLGVWAGITIAKAADFTYMLIKGLLDKMLASLRTVATQCITRGVNYTAPLTIAGLEVLSGLSGVL